MINIEKFCQKYNYEKVLNISRLSGGLMHKMFKVETDKGVYCIYPFPDDNTSITMKHLENKKWFALIMNVKDKVYLNVKTDPNYSELLRSSYDYIIPAYHMNKEHWNTIIVDDKVDVSLVEELIEQSYELTKNKIHKRRKSK